MRTVLEVEGMSCSHCEQRIHKYLGGLNGIDQVSVNLGNGTVTVEHAQTVSEDAIKEVIEELGYTVG